jgi:hypothetical protein
MKQLETAYWAEIAAFRQARAGQDAADAWHYLERAHILSQQILRLHLHVHAVLLTFALSRREWREVRGQVLRLMLAPSGRCSAWFRWETPGGHRSALSYPYPSRRNFDMFWARNSASDAFAVAVLLC